MQKNKVRSILIILIINIIFISIPNTGRAATLHEKYMGNINVKLTAVGDVDNQNFTLNADYSISGEPTKLLKNLVYNISINSGVLTIKYNNAVVYTSNQDVLINPPSDSSLITLNGVNYLGSIKFKKINDKSFYLINSLGIESYLIGVVPYESYESWPIEALKAQTVAARTYALYHKGSGDYDVLDNTSSQVYKGYDSSNRNCIQAINDTKGEVLTYNNKLIEAFFSASNGGYTEAAENVFSESLPYCIAKKDDFDAVDSSYKFFSTKISYSDSEIESFIKSKHADWNLKQFIKIDVNNIKAFESGRISSLPIIFADNNGKLQTKAIDKTEARSLFKLPSSKYTVTSPSDAEFDSYIGGNNRYETSMTISNKTFSPSSTNKIKNVVIATGNDFPDSLSGAVLAKKYNAPILLVETSPDTEYSKKVIEYINNNVDKSGKVYILGGTGVVNQNFETKFKQIGFNNIFRLGGTDRVDTSNKINSEINAGTGTPIVIATGKDFADALSISPIAASKGWPIFLIGSEISKGLNNYLINNKPSKVYIAGGTGVVTDTIKNQIKNVLGYSDDNIIRLGGKNRYDTSRIINSNFALNTNKVVLATGMDFPDALSGSVYAALIDKPIMLADSSDYINAVSYVKALSSSQGKISLEALGLSGAVNQSTVNNIVNSACQGKYTFDVKGNGHGVGLSQWGSYYRAFSKTNPQNYKQILGFYYNNAVLENIS